MSRVNPQDSRQLIGQVVPQHHAALVQGGLEEFSPQFGVHPAGLRVLTPCGLRCRQVGQQRWDSRAIQAQQILPPGIDDDRIGRAGRQDSPQYLECRRRLDGIHAARF